MNDVEESAKRLRAVQGRAIEKGRFCFKCQQSYFDKHNCPSVGLPVSVGRVNLQKHERTIAMTGALVELILGFYNSERGIQKELGEIRERLGQIVAGRNGTERPAVTTDGTKIDTGGNIHQRLDSIQERLGHIGRDVSVIRANTRPLADKLLGRE